MNGHSAPRLCATILAVGVLAQPSHLALGKLDPTALGGPDRFLTFISTDKPFYRPGERVHARGVVLEAARHRPLPANVLAFVRIEVRGPKGDVVATGSTSTADSVWAFGWDVPSEQAGGEYTVKVSYPREGYTPAERKFDVRAFRAPRLKSQITFLRDGYGPGDKVTATLEVHRAEGGAPVGAKVTATALVDGQEVARLPAKVDERGRCTVAFPLPEKMTRGEGALAFAIEDGGVVETAAKTIPILLQTVSLALFPEGGELVAGLAGRVYFEARTPAGKPADIAGEVVSGQGEVVARFRSEHEGRGRFQLTAKKGESYTLRVTEPSGVAATFPLPEVKPVGALLRAEQEVTPAGGSVRLSVSLAGMSKARVTLSKREVELASAEVRSGSFSLNPRDADGVLVATVWDHDGKPLAERLVFRQPRRPLSVTLKTDKKRYAPGEVVKLTVRTARGGDPVSAVVGLTVTDDSVLEMVEKREQAPRLPVMVLLEPEVRELADAHVYLDPKHPKARLAVDLLLGTQGWRRFAFVDYSQFLAANGDAARRVLAFRNFVRPPPTSRGIGGPKGGQKSATGGARDRLRSASRPPSKPAEEAEDFPAMAAAPRPQPAPVAPAAIAPAAPARPSLAKAKKELAAPDPLFARAEPARRRPSPHPVASGGTLVPVRVYAHAARPDRKPTDRIDFTETLYWNAGVRTNPKTGEATVSFALSDAVTSFKASADAFGADGALGEGSIKVQSVQPFSVEPKLPLEVTSGDVIRLPVALVNGTTAALGEGKLEVKVEGDVEVGEAGPAVLGPSARVRRVVELKVGHKPKPAQVVVRGTAGGHEDNVTRSLSVKPRGFPQRVAFGGLVGPKAQATHTFTLPADLVPGSVSTQLVAYPTPLGNLTESLAGLIREPHGCFEQTSSTTYPLTMAQQYFLSHTGVDPKLVSSAKEKLERGYQRLVGFECQDKGYEWFGHDPGHEALTAFGLLHFTDMGQVREIDRAMLSRTRSWLLAQRDGKGGFSRKRRALHTWVEEPDTSNAYILWALLESGEREVRPEVAALKEAAARSSNSYVHALAANVFRRAGEREEAKKLLQRLAGKQGPSGAVEGATQSIVGSTGAALSIETTALATLAWLEEPAFAANVERAMRYLAESQKGGRFGSTQSTVLALRAIVAYDKARSKARAPGSVRVFVDGRPVGSAVKFEPSTEGALALPDISELMAAGERRLELRMEGGAPMPYAVTIDFHAVKPESSPDAKLGLEVKLGRTEVAEGDLVEARAVVTNRTGEKLPTAVAIVGLPGGLEPRHEHLKELVKRGVIDAYEVLGRDVVLYWRGVQPNARREVALSLVAAVPGSYTGPASRAYLYYGDEHKSWVEALAVSIAPKAGER